MTLWKSEIMEQNSIATPPGTISSDSELTINVLDDSSIRKKEGDAL